MKKVYICSPIHGDTRNNIINAVKYTKFAVEKGYSPYTPQLLMLCFDRTDDEFCDKIYLTAKEHLWFCDEIWIFGEEDKYMKEIISFAKGMRMCRKRYNGYDTARIQAGGVSLDNK